MTWKLLCSHTLVTLSGMSSTFTIKGSIAQCQRDPTPALSRPREKASESSPPLSLEHSPGSRFTFSALSCVRGQAWLGAEGLSDTRNACTGLVPSSSSSGFDLRNQSKVLPLNVVFCWFLSLEAPSRSHSREPCSLGWLGAATRSSSRLRSCRTPGLIAAFS